MIEFVFGAVAGGVVVHFFKEHKRAQRKKAAEKNSVTNTENQLRFIENATLSKRRLMNKSEYKAFAAIEKFLAAQTKRFSYRLMAQVSMGEFIATENKRAYSSFNSKRIDFLLIDPYGNPAVAVEYQGDGHFQGNAPERDMVKKTALRKSGIEFVEIQSNHRPEDITNTVSSALDRYEKQIGSHW
ncbi:DUF2726 domain-containing protein [Pelagibius sp. Alg239-R121]|uniref:DUF2726 domain-containing protein n=1 Tax=Pelagibius sp. Alg239-R121 TaxID=2993448 RepID=UPI0024A64779|nr:DUF2726 domain-containing protein [Pelagibius sp. Alg239-R121]